MAQFVIWSFSGNIYIFCFKNLFSLSSELMYDLDFMVLDLLLSFADGALF